MKLVQLLEPGLDGIALREVPDPVPRAGELVLRMKATSLNFRDLAVASGKYKAKLPLIPLSDGVGVIEAVGEGVTNFHDGERVMPIFAPRWIAGPPTDDTASPALGGDIDGVLSERVVCSADAVVRAPAHLTDMEAATLPCAGVTAWSAVIGFGRVKPGDTVLIEGTGGVALFALQFAKLAGARVAVLSSTAEKLQSARELGADLLFNYRETPDWGPAVRAATGGVDLVVETVGAETLGRALTTLNRGARVAQVGLLSGATAPIPLQTLIPRAVNLQGIYVGSRASFESMVRAIELHRLRPVISDTFGFWELRRGLDRLASGGHFGKITLGID